jgi:hypothetical protein
MTEPECRPPLGEGPISAIIACQADAAFVDAWRSAVEKAAPGSQVLTDDEPTSKLGESLRRLFPRCEHASVLIIVPDVPHRPGELKTLLDAAKEADVVAGVRPGQTRPAKFARLGWFGRLLARVLFGVALEPPRSWLGWPAARRRWRYRWRFGLRLHDPESGLILLRRDVWARCPTQSNGRFAVVELLAKANFAGAMIAEVLLGPPGKTAAPGLESDPRDERVVFRSPVFLSPSGVQPAE